MTLQASCCGREGCSPPVPPSTPTSTHLPTGISKLLIESVSSVYNTMTMKYDSLLSQKVRYDLTSFLLRAFLFPGANHCFVFFFFHLSNFLCSNGYLYPAKEFKINSIIYIHSNTEIPVLAPAGEFLLERSNPLSQSGG